MGKQQAPAWADELVAQVAATHGITLPRLSWRAAKGETSSGVYYRTKAAITVSAGQDHAEVRMVVLHEMAHHLAHVLGRAEKGHGEAFYFICWALYIAYGVPMDLAVAAEFQYKAAAENTLLKMGVKLNTRERKAGDYGDTCRALKLLRGSARKWRKKVALGGGNLVFYHKKAAEAAERAAKVYSAGERLHAEWKATPV